MSYRIDLDIYNGPMDLLLYLIRKEEVEIVDIPIGRITEQYMAYLDLLAGLDINVAAEFLVMAATLMEIKSRMILPRPEMPADEGAEEDEGDPRLELVRQLLEYKRFKEAAQDLESLGDDQSRRYSRPAAQVVVGPDDQRIALDEMFRDVEVWDLLNAFARIMRSINIAPREVIYDDTPIEQIAESVLTLMESRRTVLFSDLITTVFSQYEQVGRIHVVGAFLAILECIRQKFLAISQDAEFGDLRLFWREDRTEDGSIEIAEKIAPPQAHITSREAAREAGDGIDRPQGRFDDDEFLDTGAATEFDEALDAITIPDISIHKPTYTDSEILGREEPADAAPPADAATAEEAASSNQSAADQPADAAPSDERPPNHQ